MPAQSNQQQIQATEAPVWKNVQEATEKHLAQAKAFTNDSAMMIAYERSLESSRDDALFQDPFAKALAFDKGASLSENFSGMCPHFGMAGWPEFHRQWVAVRTKFIDDQVSRLAKTGDFAQLVNLGAGMDTRAYRLECYKSFSSVFEVDMPVVNNGKAKVFELLGSPAPHCGQVRNVDLDFLDTEKTLTTELGAAQFDAAKPCVFVSEGLIMYLGAEGKRKLIRDVSAVAAAGSVFILQFLNGSDTEAAKANPSLLDNALSVEEAETFLGEGGWSKLEFNKFGDSTLNYGRFPTDRFAPQASFSFVVCVKD